MSEISPISTEQAQHLKTEIQALALELGFQQMGVCDTNLGEHIARYQAWLDEGLHGELDYMARHGDKRWRPEKLVEGTLRVLSLRMDYDVPGADPLTLLDKSEKAYISRYTLGRDYHKVMRNRLKHLIAGIQELAAQFQFRAFVDSAPVLERALAQKSGLGWFGKNTMILNRGAGSWFFLGEIYTDLPLPLDAPYEEEHCGRCTACLDVCPTQAFKGPYLLDARRCISYLTIEHKGSIAEELRPMMGNRIFGCDDCQLVCPWNRFKQPSKEEDFSPRHQLDDTQLLELFAWDEETFLRNTEGSAIRRTGYEGWQRNLAIALGNGPASAEATHMLKQRRTTSSPLVREHIDWALRQLKKKQEVSEGAGNTAGSGYEE